MGRTGYYWVQMGGSALALCAAMPACAQDTERQQYEMPEQEFAQSVRAVVDQSGATIIAPTDLLAGLRAPALRGEFTPEQALVRLVAGTPLRVAHVGDALVLRRALNDRAQAAAAQGGGDSEILVTGTRIRGRAPAGAAVTTINRTDIERSGYATTQQILQALPQNFGGGPNETTAATARNGADANTSYGSGINLRGLGPSSTLVLLDGERPPMAGIAGIFTDLSMIPLSAIERIEVLPDGASALYGSDAVAGVVNIIPRTGFRGLTANVRYGLGDGVDEWQASALAGARWATGHAMIAYEYYHRSRLAAADRGYVSEDLRRYGLSDYRTAAGVPGTITAGGQRFGIPTGQDGTALEPGALIPGQVNVSDRYAGSDILPRQARHAVFANFAQDIGANVELHGQALFGDRRYDVRRPTSRNALTLTVPVTNPFYVDPLGINQPVQVAYNFLNDIGPESGRGYSQALGASLSADVQLRSWTVTLGATYGQQRDGLTVYNLVNTARAAVALADTDPASALNLFGDGSANNPATIDFIRGTLTSGGRYRLWSFQLRGEGPLVALPAGDVRLALGVEHRRERYSSDPAGLDITTLTPSVSTSSAFTGSREVTAAYAELAVPLSDFDCGGLAIGRLDVSAALRGERYAGIGDTFNPKFGLSWQPVDALRLRGSWGTSFRAPSFLDLRQDAGSISYFAYPLPDPAAAGGVTNALILRGNDPDLGPERATSWTAGFDVRPDTSRGFSAALTYFNIVYRDRIVNPSSALFSFFTNRDVYAPIIDDSPDPAAVAGYYASPYFLPLTPIPASAITAVVDARTQNLASQRLSGLDFDVAYRLPFSEGAAEFGISGSYLIDFRQKLTADAPSITLADTIGNPPDLRLRGRASVSSGGVGAAVFANYLDGYTNNSSGAGTPVDSWLTIDLQLRYETESNFVVPGVSLVLSVTNLFDRDPPRTAYLLGTTTVGYDVENASPLGRIVALQLSKQW
ncbi:TonB-dependent receptor [Stakelama sp. CBK3Z-3]|uniref:TonB-dependent receptor n=1 Tax=Stakelama flava TaxID=2860338 RepID=A0ABS6XPT7_9SPHN|nr:TonB-dependent receptor [Stakelama flava]MBW4332228.1 TonB-dependent receptor [Stakelama flava]